MVKENLPLELLRKHEARLELKNPLYIENEKSLLEGAAARSAVVFLPKSKALIDMTLALVSGIVEEGGTVVLAGTNDAGIRSAKAAYEKNIGPVDEKIVGNHSALYVGRNARLGASKKIEDFFAYSPIEHGEATIDVASLPGVFSAGELDEGTKLLLDTIPYDKKSILDVGCGAGVIGAIYKKKNPQSEITMTDASRLATIASIKTLEKNGLQGKVIETHILDGIEGAYDLILSNPPFHKGVSTDYSFIDEFVKAAKKRLVKGGEVYVVANSFLPYKETLERHIGPTDILVDTNKFRVYRSK